MNEYQAYLDEALRLARIIGVDDEKIPTSREPDEGYFIRPLSTNWGYIYTERGDEDIRATGDLGELLYWVFRDITFTMASEFESKNRRYDEDFRRQLFDHHAALLSKLNPRWEQRIVEEYAKTLKQHPFVDGSNPQE